MMFSSCGQSAKETKVNLNSEAKQGKIDLLCQDEGVVINGVRWATRNVDKPKTFAASSDDAGMLYQWNRRIGWSATDPMINSNDGTAWDTTKITGTTWDKSNDPSPVGWRVPTLEEIKSLLDTEKVTNEWTTHNDVSGRKFTDKTSGKSIFLPAAGYRDHNYGTFVSGMLESGFFGRKAGLGGFYWSSTQFDSNNTYAYYLSLDSNSAYWDNACSKSYGYSVRSVAD